MKCPNCGFETDTNFCPMCGIKIEPAHNEHTLPPSDFEKQANPNGAGASFDVNPYASQPQNSNTYQPPYSNYNNVNPSQPNFQTPYPTGASIGQGAYNMPASPQNPDMPQNPYAPQNNYHMPPDFSPASQMPPQYAPQKSGGKAAAIIIGAIVGAVIIAGAVIMSVSAVNGNSVTDNITIPDLYDDYSSITDDNQYKTGDEVSTAFGTMTLKEVKREEAADYSGLPDCDIYRITFEVTNNLEERLIVSSDNFRVTDADGEFGYIEEVYDYDDYDTVFYLSEGETGEVYIVYAVAKDVNSIDIEYNYYNYDINYNDYYYYFTAEGLHPDAESTPDSAENE